MRSGFPFCPGGLLCIRPVPAPISEETLKTKAARLLPPRPSLLQQDLPGLPATHPKHDSQQKSDQNGLALLIIDKAIKIKKTPFFLK